METAPASADIYIKEYKKPDSAWRLLGKSPVKGIRLPKVYLRWQYRAEGYEVMELAAPLRSKMKVALLKIGQLPAGMVLVSGRRTAATLTGFPSVTLGDYFIDRHEVSNRQFKEFVDHGGYAKGDYWKQALVKDGKTRRWAEAVADFRDTTGKPGPATWTNGTYPAGQEEYPVTGVCWFEAAAYAEFAGKRLPSASHWSAAAQSDAFGSIVPLSNFSGKGLVRAGSYQGMSAVGAYDMAGNAREWCWNEAGPDSRFLLGGGWSDPDYTFAMRNAASPFDRSTLNGLRCIKLLAPDTLPKEVDAAIVPETRDYSKETPVSDESFQVFRSLFSYDKTPLDARLDSSNDTNPDWREEKVSFHAAYGNERMGALMYLPKKTLPPYQTVVFFPGSGAQNIKSSEGLRIDLRAEFVLRHGRAFVYPIYKGTYERRLGTNSWELGERAYRDFVVQLSQDLGRTLDYLETRSDLQSDKIGYLGVSWGAAIGPVLLAVENRVKVGVLVGGGFDTGKGLPEIEPINFAPRVTIPTLMLNGRYDFRFPLESLQKPMFRLLGTPPERKRHKLYDAGHGLSGDQISKDVLDWLDKYLGPVK